MTARPTSVCDDSNKRALKTMRVTSREKHEKEKREKARKREKGCQVVSGVSKMKGAGDRERIAAAGALVCKPAATGLGTTGRSGRVEEEEEADELGTAAACRRAAPCTADGGRDAGGSATGGAGWRRSWAQQAQAPQTNHMPASEWENSARSKYSVLE